MFFLLRIKLEKTLKNNSSSKNPQQIEANKQLQDAIDLLKTQILDMSFIVRYILSDLYQFTDEDRDIDVDMVIKYQPHIQREKLMISLLNYNSDDDSVEDFESYIK